jgi:hypothetical protein
VSREDSDEEMVLLLGALAEESRLRVLAAVVLGASKEPEIAKVTGLSASEVQRSLSRLVASRLVKAGSSGFVVDTYRLKEVVRERRSAERQAEPTAALLGATPEQAVVLDRFLAGGRLTALPTGGRRRRLVLDFLSSKFSPGEKYSERAVNEILTTFNNDFASLRRHLVDEGFLDRADGFYWRSGGSFSVD